MSAAPPATTTSQAQPFPKPLALENYKASSFRLAAVFALCTGFTGLQRFYTRDYGLAFAQLCLGPPGWFTLALFLSGGVLWLIPWFFIGYIWTIVDLVTARSIVEKKNMGA